jgi:hypothetical protein
MAAADRRGGHARTGRRAADPMSLRKKFWSSSFIHLPPVFGE